ncbi:MAG: AI-2E family transporter [Acidiferrobacteraceae bacterium]
MERDHQPDRPPGADRRRHVREIDELLAGFVRAQWSVMLALAVFYTFGLWFAGPNLALPIGLFSGFVSFAPNLRFLLGFCGCWSRHSCGSLRARPARARLRLCPGISRNSWC